MTCTEKVVDTRKGCEDRFPALLDLPFPLIRQILMPAYPEKRGRKTLVQLKKRYYLCIAIAEVAQLVEHNLAKVRVAGSSPVFRSKRQ